MGVLTLTLTKDSLFSPSEGPFKMDTFSQLFQLFITGITIGSIYAMVAVGFNMIYNATDVVNFAQGEFVMLGGLVMVSLHGALKINMPLAFLLTVIIVSGVGIAFERFTINPLKKPSLITLILITIAVSFLLRGIAMFVWGKDSLALPAFYGERPILLWGAAVLPQTLWIIGFVIALVVFLTYFFNFTILGKERISQFWETLSGESRACWLLRGP